MHAAGHIDLHRHARRLTQFVEFDVPTDLVGSVSAKIARRKTTDKIGWCSDQTCSELGGKNSNAVGFEFFEQLLMRDEIGLPKLFEPPRSHGGGIHGGDVGVGQKCQELQPFQSSDTKR